LLNGAILIEWKITIAKNNHCNGAQISMGEKHLRQRCINICIPFSVHEFGIFVELAIRDKIKDFVHFVNSRCTPSKRTKENCRFMSRRKKREKKKLCREHQQYNSSSEIKIFKSRSKYFESRSTQEIFSLQSQKLLCVIAFQMFVKCSQAFHSVSFQQRARHRSSLYSPSEKKFVSIM
jgi:hypothetical protein